MVGILTEKPSAGRNFAKALGGTRGTYNGDQYVIVSARGHLYEFAGPEAQVPKELAAKYTSWDLGNLPWNERDIAWKRARKADVAGTLKDIKTVLSACDEIVIATDVDPTGEGQLLAWEILSELKLKPKKFSRMIFMDESEKEIRQAFVQRQVLPPMEQDPEYKKAFYRSRWDFLSMQFTRVATKCGNGTAVLRQGRLKSAMVVLVGDALKAVGEYKKVPFYQNRFRDENGVTYTNPGEPMFPDKGQVPCTYNKSAVVCDSRTMKSSSPPKLLDLAALSARLSGRGVKAKDVLACYQKMYEAQVVSYPRTEDKTITPEQFNELLPKVDAIACCVGVDPGLLTHRSPRSTHVKTGGAHGANRPGPNVPASLNDVEAKYGKIGRLIYETLALNYLATLAEDFEYEAQKGHVSAYPAFIGSCTVPRKAGWKAVYSVDSDDEDSDSNERGLGTMASPFVHEGFPPKPPVPTMKWLMKQLEKRDVGTGATRTSIYAEVTNEKSKFPLMKESRGKISMTEFGEMSYKLLPGTHIGDLCVTERLQGEMRDVAAGKLDPDVALSRIRQMVLDDIRVMQENGKSIRKETGNAMYEKKESYEGTWKGRQVKFNRTWSGHRFTDEECEALCRGEKIVVSGLIGKSGKPYAVEGNLAEQEYNGHKYVGFNRLGFAQSGSGGVPDTWCGHMFTDEEKELLKCGKKLHLEDFVSKVGKSFSADITYEKDENGRMGIKPHW